jgi:acetyl esterase/lipase
MIPADVWAVLREHGRSFTPEVVAAQRALFAELLGPITAPVVLRDVAYGPHERQRLDLHAAAPLEAGASRPMLIFVHGGGFIGGERRDPVQPFYDNVGAWAASQGWIGATMSYRRAPEHLWPAGAEDVGSAVRALRLHAAEIGGDPDRIILFGHSAGAAHVAGYLAGHGGQAETGLAGVVLQSGIYSPAAADEEIAGMVALYYGPHEASAVPALAALSVPLWLGVGEHDPLTFHDQAERLDDPRVAAGHSHFTSIYSLGLDAAYPRAVAEFIHGGLR